MRRMADSPESEGQESQGQPGWQTAIGVVIVVALAVLVVFLIVEAIPHHVKNAKNPSFVDNIFANAVVLFLTRLALFAAAIYVVVSVGGLIGGRQWIAEFGPFKAAAPIKKLDQGADALEKSLADALETVRTLEQRLEDSDEALREAREHIANLLDHIDTMEGQKEGN
jgi:hypothetical protein